MTLSYSSAKHLYYRPSGAAPPMSTTLGAAGAWVAVAVIAAVYAYADLYLKVADKISALIVMAFAVAMGFVVFGVIKLARVRNFFIVALIATTSAILALYVSWVVWEHALIQREETPPALMAMFKHPTLIWRFAQAINEVGTFTHNNDPVKGTELSIAWIVEALAILGCVTAIPILMLRQQTFCETCNRWSPKPKPMLRVANGDDRALRAEIEAKNLAHLNTLTRVNSQTPVHLLVDLTKCPTCEEMNLMTISRVTIKVNKKGQAQTETKKLIDRIYLTTAEAEQLAALAQPPAAPAPPQASAAANATSTTMSPNAPNTPTPPSQRDFS